VSTTTGLSGIYYRAVQIVTTTGLSRLYSCVSPTSHFRAVQLGSLGPSRAATVGPSRCLSLGPSNLGSLGPSRESTVGPSLLL